MGTDIITITLGRKGTFVSTREKQFMVPSIKVDTIDTTGAGDAMGCLLQQIAQLPKPHQVMDDVDRLADMVFA